MKPRCSTVVVSRRLHLTVSLLLSGAPVLLGLKCYTGDPPDPSNLRECSTLGGHKPLCEKRDPPLGAPTTRGCSNDFMSDGKTDECESFMGNYHCFCNTDGCNRGEKVAGVKKAIAVVSVAMRTFNVV